MIMAVLGSVGGDFHALEAAIAAIEEEGIQTIVCTGDCLGPGHGNAPAIVDRLERQGVSVVQGAWDRKVARFVRARKRLLRELGPGDFDALRRAHESCRSGDVEWFAGLPGALDLKVDGVEVRLCGGGYLEAAEALRDGGNLDLLRRLRESAPASVFVLGGRGEPVARHVDDAFFVNPGSLAAGDSAARFALLSTEATPYTAEFRVVGY